MPLTNPVPGFNFAVFLMDIPSPGGVAGAVSGSLSVGGGGLSGGASGALTALGGLAVGVAKALITGTFSEVSGLNAEMETEEYREGGRNTGPLKFVKWGKYPNLVFKRGVTFNTDLWDWYYQVIYGSSAPLRKNGIIMLTDRGGGVAPGGGLPGLALPVLDRMPVAVWFFNNGLPEKLQGPSLNAKNNEIAIETLEIVHEGIVRVGPALVPGAGEALSAVGL